MKNNYLSYALFLTMLAAGSVRAQENDLQIQKKHLDKQGNLSLVTFKKESKYSLNQAKEAIKKDLQLENTSFAKIKDESDDLGFTHEKQQQFYKGIKVGFGEYTFHAKNGAIASASGKIFKIEKEDLTTSLSKTAALQKALASVGAKTYLWENPEEAKVMGDYKKPEGELLILPGEIIKEEQARLVYKFDVYATNPISRNYIYVDANSGEVVYKDAIIKHLDRNHNHSEHETSEKLATTTMFATGNAATKYSGTQTIETSLSGGTYVLKGISRGNGVETYNMQMGINYNSAVNFTDSDNNWTAAEHANSDDDDAALDAHWGAEKTYDYFYETFNRDSYDDNGAAIRSYVHFDLIEYGYSNQDNAFWNGSVMTYGDGTSFSPLTSLDIAAHEIGHAICENTANLTYSYESGAMNEGFSDIWAASVEYYADPTKDTWVLGEEIGGPIRSLSNPNTYGQPDTYLGTNWYTGSGDNGGVHYNSGVLNHWFYILTVGKSGTNDNGDAYDVTGINITKAAAIAYRLESVYLSSSSQYDDARVGGIQAAIDLYGAGSAEEIAVTNAWYAVGIGDAYDNGVVTPTECSATISSFPYSESFESGDGWNQVSGDDGDWVNDASGTPSSNTGPSAGAAGSYYMFLEASSNTSTGAIGSNATAILESPCFDLSSESSATFTFQNHMYGTSVGSLELQASTDGASWTTLWSDSDSQGDQWNEESVSLGSYLGQSSVRLRFVGTTGSSWSSDIAIDDLALTTSGSASDTTAPTAPSNITASSVTETSATISWSASSDNTAVTGYNVYQGSSLLGTTTNTSASITSLTAGTTYTYAVTAYDAAGNESTSNSVTFTTSSSGGGTPTYCDSEGSNSSYEWIDYVAFGGMTNSTGNDGGYADYTNNVATVAPGSTNSLVFSCGFSSSTYTEYWAIWIDYDQDGEFEDSELVASGSSSSAANLSADVTIPSTASLGTTTMRVSMKYNAAQTACETFTYGEVEDYTVAITNSFMGVQSFGATASVDADTLGNEGSFVLTAYPNPATNFVQVNMQSRGEDVQYKIVNTIGQLVQKGLVTSNNINISSLTAGIYLLEVHDGQKTFNSKLIKK